MPAIRGTGLQAEQAELYCVAEHQNHSPQSVKSVIRDPAIRTSAFSLLLLWQLLSVWPQKRGVLGRGDKELGIRD